MRRKRPRVSGGGGLQGSARRRSLCRSKSSTLARARKIVAQKVPARSQQQTLRTMDNARLRELVTRFASAFERRDAGALVALLTEDVTWSMPPLPHWYHGLG